jgi:hypothetical protein
MAQVTTTLTPAGHDKIESTKLYLHVHIKLMRKVLFDETF